MNNVRIYDWKRLNFSTVLKFSCRFSAQNVEMVIKKCYKSNILILSNLLIQLLH